MISLESILPIALAFCIVTISPGPANLAVATVAMSAGRPAGMRFGLGLAFGLAFWGVVAATGMGAVLQSTEILLYALKILGGLYLLWLAMQAGKTAIAKQDNPACEKVHGRWFVRGLMLNVSNPKAVVAWMAALSMGLGVGNESSQVVVATLLCIALGFINYLGHAFAFSLPGFMAGYRRFRRWIEGAIAGLFAVAGIALIRSAFHR